MEGDLSALRAWLAAHPSTSEEVVTWQGGDAQMRPDGTRETVMPWPVYTATIADYWTALDAAGWGGVDTRDYMAVTQAWRAANGGEAIDAGQLGRMDRTTLFNTLRSYNRAERFCDGAWASVFGDGRLHAGAQAVLTLPGPAPDR